MNKTAAVLRLWPKLAVGIAAGIAASMSAPMALAQTSYDQGYFVTATRDDPDVGPVNNQSNNRYTYFPDPVPYFAAGSASVSRTDPNGTYFGSAYSIAEAQAGDRFVKASAQSFLDFTTGATSGQGNAIWSSRATPGSDAMADVSVLLDRSLYFGDFLSNSDRGNQILDFATANIPAFPQAEALRLEAGIYFNVLIQEVETGIYWNSSIQEEVNRAFVFVKDQWGNPIVAAGIGDRAYSIFRTGTNMSGVATETMSFNENLLNYDAPYYPPRYGTSFASIFGINDVFLRADRTYDISLSLSCYSGVSALAGLADASAYSAGCNASNSGYWLGLDNFRDFNGNAIAPVSFASTDSGFDLSQGSPFAPGGGNAVPEPATWALMIGGFGLAGSVLRRRRAALA